ncbi:MAG TPA: 1-deoxy-D-xylulose-5-phosphate reductoisomerase [Thermodesulfobacteriota bacterium]|nr:1-deoxy-D-xylulose-5-phosphate reductoisomerase [Thermodesulfobacteriota bacterium]
MKNISILGSTGSIGRQTLEVISQFPDEFRVVGISAGKNVDLLKAQVLKFKPHVASLKDKKDSETLSRELSSKSPTKILWGEEGAEAVATHPQADMVVSAMVGASGLNPTLSAIKARKNIALANKEVLVMAGGILTREAQKYRVKMLPVDSEHSALFQVLRGSKKEYVQRLILTASGGPFLKTPKEKLNDVTVEVALNHPTWKMGKKITIDSATLMNKGFEVIEARWLFGIPSQKITVWIHPQSVVHSMVEYIDGSVMAQMSVPDMRIPIAYALSYPERVSIENKEIVPSTFGELTFNDADLDKFPALSLAYQAIEIDGTMPAVMSAANEIAVEAFLKGELQFIDIVEVVKRVMELHNPFPASTVEEILESDAWARKTTESIIERW